MTKDQLNQHLNNFFVNEEELLAEIYFILKEDDSINIRLADIEQHAQVVLTRQFIEKVKQDILENEELGIINISNADDRANVIYEYDLDEIPNELECIDHIIDNEDLPMFSFENDRLNTLRGIVILIEKDGENLVLYKQHYPVSVFKKDSVFGLRRLGNNHRFTQLNDDIIKINSTFEFFKFNSTLFIKDLKTLEKFFGFHDVIRRKAEECLEGIEQVDILVNPEELRALINDISFARKLTKVANSSPVLGNIPTNSIISFVESYPALRGQFQYNEDRSKINLSTKKSKQLFIKLLNDDFLHSELTRRYYDSLAKDNVEAS